MVVLHVYLTRDPVYRPARKYLTTILDFAVMDSAFLISVSIAPEYVPGILSLAVTLLLLIVSGLRYSREVVLLAGALAFTSYLLLLNPFAPLVYQRPLRWIGAILMGLSTLAMTTVVVSLIRLHRESVSRASLSRFLPPELVEQVDGDPALLAGRYEHQPATVLFVDIRGFTSLSEALPPQRVFALLNRYLSEMSESVLSHQGMLDKYIGDAVDGGVRSPTTGQRRCGQCRRLRARHGATDRAPRA